MGPPGPCTLRAGYGTEDTEEIWAEKLPPYIYQWQAIDENPDSRSSAAADALEWGSLGKISSLGEGLSGPKTRPDRAPGVIHEIADVE